MTSCKSDRFMLSRQAPGERSLLPPLTGYFTRTGCQASAQLTIAIR
ncbi:hypothetical protein [Coleofasciculus sp. FACHB-SPT36]|nr:hypothetical protein [Coleofasciculus sp. FACHB-SPT36]MBD2539339.1 hypothetical protein [Coleofasciculus sp. FACHB-SPT36]